MLHHNWTVQVSDVMASWLGDDDDAALYTLAYFSSAWTRPVDALALTRLRALLGGVNALNQQHQLIGLLEVRRHEDGDEDGDSSSGGGAKAQRLEPSYGCRSAVAIVFTVVFNCVWVCVCLMSLPEPSGRCASTSKSRTYRRACCWTRKDKR